jgi:autotransporter-associated beta strand protein
MGVGINASTIDVAAGTLASLGGTAQPQTRWGTSPITVENNLLDGAMLRAEDGGVCPNVITLNGGDGTLTGSYTHQGALCSSSRNNGGSTTNFNIFTNTIILAADSSVGSYFNTMFISGNITGSFGLTKVGPNPMNLSGSNSFTGSLTINTGTVQLGSSNAIPAGASVAVNGSSTLDLNGTNASVGSLSDDSGGLGTVDNSSANAASLTLITGASFVGAVKNTGGGPLSIINVSGYASLGGANSYTGSNVVQAGTLEINIPTGTTTGGLVQIADSATLFLHRTTPGASLKAAGATIGIGTSGATTLNIDLNNYGNPSAPIINATNGTGVLAVNGTVSVNLENFANLITGQFPLIKYTTKTGSGTFVLVSPLNAGISLSNNVANHSIDVVVAQAITTWIGYINNLWDYSTTNWLYKAVHTNYQDGLPILVDDTSHTNIVNLTNNVSPGSALSPGSLLVNTTNTYTFFGSSPLSGGTLTKNGPGTLILDVAGNSYASTTISGGTLQVGNNDSSGDLGSGNVDDEGTLIFNLTNNYTVPGIISGAGVVVQNNTNILTLSQADTYSGGTVVSQGILKLGNNTSLGVAAGSVLATVASGASLDLAGKQIAGAGYVSINGNGFVAGAGALQTTAGMGCPIGCTAVGVKYLRLAGNTTIGDSSGDMQLGTDVNANGGAGVCAIDGQGFSLTKIGNNTLIVEGTNFTALSQFVLASGGMIFANTARTPFGTTCTMVISNGAWMDAWDNFANSGITLANNFIIGPGGGQLRNTRGMYYGHAAYNTFSGGFTLNDNLSVLNTSTYSGAPGNILTLGQMNFTGPISGSGGVISLGANPISLTGANTYTGTTVVTNNATIQLSTIQQGRGTYLIYDNGTLDVPAQNGYTTVPMTNLMVGSASGAFVSLARFTSLSTSNAPITASNLTVIGTSTILLPPVAFNTPGQYPLIKYGAMNGGGTFALLRGTPATISNNVANSSIDLVVPGGNPVEWVGNVSTSWDIATTPNWLYQAASTTYQQSGSIGDSVTFDDTTTKTNVTITTPVSPAVVIVNTTNTYTFFGTNITGPSSLVKNGTGMLVLSNLNNNFTGGTLVNAGTLKVASALNPLVALNNLTGTVTVNSGATLDMGSNNLQTLVINASGSGVGGNGAIQANYGGGGQAWGVSIVNQTGNLTIGGNNRWDVRNGSKQWNVSSNGATLTKVGSGYVGLNGVTVSTNLGDIIILGGTLSQQAATTGLGNTNNTIWVGGSGTLDLNATTVPLVKNIVCSNGASLQVDGGNTLGQNVIAGPVNLVSGTINLNGNFFHGIYFSNTISGSGGLSLQYQTYLYLAASNTFTGQLYVPYSGSANNGQGTGLSFIGNGSATHAYQIIMAGIVSGQPYPGFIDVLGRPDKTLTLGTNQTLRGDNGSFVRGSVVAPAGSAISPGGISTNYQYMSISNSLTFLTGSTNYMDIYKTATLRTNDLITVSNLVTYGGTLQIQTNGSAALLAGDTFQLFSAGSSSGNFATIADTSGATWSFTPLTGVATVLTPPPTVNPSRTNIVTAVSGNQLTLSWPADHTGWTLQSNSVSLLNTGAWATVSGSTTTNKIIITMDPTQTNVFYRMKL